MKIKDLLEFTSNESTFSGNIASTVVPLGTPHIIKRMPKGQSFFGMPETLPQKPKKKRSKNR
jgi:hypothetical protein